MAIMVVNLGLHVWMVAKWVQMFYPQKPSPPRDLGDGQAVSRTQCNAVSKETLMPAGESASRWARPSSRSHSLPDCVTSSASGGCHLVCTV